MTVGVLVAAAVGFACSSTPEESTATDASSTITALEASTATSESTDTTSNASSTNATDETDTTDTATTETTAPAPVPTTGCSVASVPAGAGLDPFYTQGCQVDGFWVVANEVVDPLAIEQAAATVEQIFVTDDRLAPTLTAANIRLGIIGRDQRTTEMPEYRDLYEVFPGTDWDNRARGLGATVERPLVSAGEENVLCLPTDRYLGEDILLHEFSHVLHEFGYRSFVPGFDDDLSAAYRQAIDAGTWADTYAATNQAEYWAEGVQSFLGRNLTAEPADGIHGPIDTRAELAEADPALHALIDERLGDLTLPPQCS